MKFGTFARITSIGKADESFRTIIEYGLEACQLQYRPEKFIDADAQIIRNAAKKYNVDISAMGAGFYDTYTSWDTYFDYKLAGINSPFFGESRINRVINAARFAKEIGISDIIIHAGFVPNDPFATEYSVMLAAVRAIGVKLKSMEMNLLFETGGESPITLLRLIQDAGLDNLFINYDTANLIMYGYGNPVDALYTFGKYVRHMHAKDGFPPTDPKYIGKEAPIGQGYVDFKKIFELLKGIGYNRYVIIEREINDEEHAKGIRDSITYLKNIYTAIN